MLRTQPMRRTPFKRGKPERLALPVVPKQTGKMRVSKGPERDKAHLAKVREELCIVPWQAWGEGSSCIEAHHVRCIAPRSIGKRVSDYLTVPLCREHHARLHGMKEETFWLLVGKDPREWIRRFSDEGRAALAEIEGSR